MGFMIEFPGVVGVAFEVIAGKYGVGSDRVQQLTAAGYDAALVQRCVNDLLALFAKYGGDQ